MKKENLFTPNCIRTFSGIYMNVFEPTLDMINIVDIAHSLSHQCRFGGHLPEFYSVAQHSVLASKIVDKEDKLSALLHDASEAYLLDIPRPIKNELANYKEIEHKLMLVIAKKFGFDWPMSEAVKNVDEIMLQWEWDHLMVKTSLLPSIEPWDPATAKIKFLNTFKKYSN